MFGVAVGLVYGFSLVLALFLLHHFHARAWYWHVMSVGAALAIGLVPTPPEWKTQTLDLTIGSIFTFLFVWGICAPFFRVPHEKHTAHHV